MAAFSSSAISTYSILGGIDLRSGSPVAIDGSQTGLTIGSADVTAGVFNGSSSWATLIGLTAVGATCGITAKLGTALSATNIGQYLWEYSADSAANSGFRSEGIDNGSGGLAFRMVASPGSTNYGYHDIAVAGLTTASVVTTQFDVSQSPFKLELCADGGTPDMQDGNTTPPTGTFGTQTLYIGAKNSASGWLALTIDFIVVHSWLDDSAKGTLATALADPDTLLETVATSNYYIGADITPGNWTTSTGSGTLTSMVSETTRDDTQYIQSAVNPSADLVELEWANVQIPSVNTNHTVSYVLKGDASCQALVALLAGDATTVTAWVHTALPPTFQRFDQDLSTAACDAWSVGGYAGSHLTVTAG